MKEDRYVILTGGKNNAGDFLIKTRAKALLSAIRPDRQVVDYDGWKKLNPEQLETINNSKALVLTGGPSLQPNNRIRNNIYPLTENLDDIKVPITTFGVGYKGQKGSWKETFDYNFHGASLELLERINASGYQSSVRDYHTLNTLQVNGFHNFIMTGCPALYDTTTELKPLSNHKIKKVGFSLGISYKANIGMKKLMQQMILDVQEQIQAEEFCVFFHHSITTSDRAQTRFIQWLEAKNIAYKDISGGAEKLMENYKTCDFHIGFRVHAHIFCSSIGKPSILMSEDGRAVALKEVLNGLIFKAHYVKYNSLIVKVMNKVGLIDKIRARRETLPLLKRAIPYETNNNYIRINQGFYAINQHFEIMKSFLKNLP